MNEDHLLEDLARLARERPKDSDEEALEALCLGTLDAQAEADLLRRAQADPELRERVEAYRPLAPRVREEMVAQVQASLAVAADPAQDNIERDRIGSGETGVVVPIRRHRWWPLAAIAAIAVLWFALPRTMMDPLPSYTLEVLGGTQEMRSGIAPGTASTTGRRFSAGDRLTLVLRPATAIEGVAAARAFVDQSGSWVPLAAPVEIADSGAARVSFEIGRDVPAVPGPLDVWIAIGRPEALPSARLAQEGQGRAHDVAWQLLHAQVEIAEVLESY